MSDNSQDHDRQNLLIHEGSGSGSDRLDTPTATPSPALPHPRHEYHRMNSQGSVDLTHDPLPIFSGNDVESRVPVDNRTSPPPPSSWKPFMPWTCPRNSPMTPPTPGSSKAFLSPAPTWQTHDSGSYTVVGGLDLMLEMDEQDVSNGKNPRNHSLDIPSSGPQQNGSMSDNDNKRM